MRDESTDGTMMFPRLLLPFACCWLTMQAAFYWFDPQLLVQLIREIYRDPSRFALDQLLLALVCVLCSLAGTAVANGFGWRNPLARSVVSMLLCLPFAATYASWAIMVSSV